MRIVSTIAALLVLVFLTAFVACGGMPQVCSVTPIDIEEVKSDSRDLDNELEVIRGRLSKAQEDLAAWQARLAKRQAEVPELEAELVRLKKMSGVTEEMVVDVEPKARQAQDEIQLMPRGE